MQRDLSPLAVAIVFLGALATLGLFLVCVVVVAMEMEKIMRGLGI